MRVGCPCGCRGRWPDSYWDDWLRDNRTRAGRQCIRPEVRDSGMRMYYHA